MIPLRALRRSVSARRSLTVHSLVVQLPSFRQKLARKQDLVEKVEFEVELKVEDDLELELMEVRVGLEWQLKRVQFEFELKAEVKVKVKVELRVWKLEALGIKDFVQQERLERQERWPLVVVGWAVPQVQRGFRLLEDWQQRQQQE